MVSPVISSIIWIGNFNSIAIVSPIVKVSRAGLSLTGIEKAKSLSHLGVTSVSHELHERKRREVRVKRSIFFILLIFKNLATPN